MNFDARMGGQVKFLTLAMAVVLLGSLSATLEVHYSAPARMAALTTVFFIFDLLVVLGMLGWGLSWKIKRYEVQPGKLVIVRSFSRKEIACGNGASARMDANALAKAKRIVGMGGFFSISGQMRSATYGNFDAYVTDATKLVVVKTPKETVVISPGQPETFVEYFNGQRKAGPGRA